VAWLARVGVVSAIAATSSTSLGDFAKTCEMIKTRPVPVTSTSLISSQAVRHRTVSLSSLL
jgi:hypothetical protein